MLTKIKIQGVEAIASVTPPLTGEGDVVEIAIPSGQLGEITDAQAMSIVKKLGLSDKIKLFGIRPVDNINVLYKREHVEDMTDAQD